VLFNDPEGAFVSNALFYKNPVLLDKNTHRNLRIRQSEACFEFAASVHSVLLAAVEFVPAARDFPVVFTRAADGKFVPVALLGLREGENLFVADGKWRQNTYIPAFIRRYPFIPAETDSQNFSVCIDDAYAGFVSDSGEPLFDERGESSALLDRAIALMRDYHMECKRTEDFTRVLGDLDLLKEMSVRVETKDGTSFGLCGVWLVDEPKLNKLAKSEVWDLCTAGFLPLVYAHLFSQGNLVRLAALLDEPRAAQEEGDPERPDISNRTGAHSAAMGVSAAVLS
jgi:hypothetical protein